MSEIARKRVLVSGGSHRLGRAIALDLAHAGADVAISYHSSGPQAAETVELIQQEGRRGVGRAADATDTAAMADLVNWAAAELGGLDAYVHCPSGGFEPRRAGDVDLALWNAAFDTTARGFFFAAQAAHRHLREAGGGTIVAITDVAGIQPWPLFAAHGAAKAALIHLVKTLAVAWGPDNIRVSGVAPGPVLLQPGDRGAGEDTVLGRHGTPADVCRTVRFCLESDFVTGQNVIVDGGRLLRE